MNTAKSNKFKKIVQEVKSPFGEGNTSEKITEIIKSIIYTDKIDLKKQFYDIQYDL
jgi:GDP/UDP-N,N'-diacetylbacillosamine 2-epimerase (hydrolysing)